MCCESWTSSLGLLMITDINKDNGYNEISFAGFGGKVVSVKDRKGQVPGSSFLTISLNPFTTVGNSDELSEIVGLKESVQSLTIISGRYFDYWVAK